MRKRRESVESKKARFIESLYGASFAKLHECEVTLKVSIASAKAGRKYAASLGELEELLAVVKAEMRKR